ncbi:MAG: sodium/proton-translocating pyrophosphatase, partial [Sulfolobales archaeon]|nr:sodium/proton-translocating pyrophosphatase [Sulfolobales archaeon]
MLTLTLSALAGALALVYAVYLALSVLKYPAGGGRAFEIHEFIREGAGAYLRRQYGVISAISVALALAILALGL